MSTNKAIITQSYLTDIADAIRAKLGSVSTYTPEQMNDAILSIVTADLGTKTIVQNGTYDASDDNLDGYSQVIVDTPTYTFGTKSISENGTYNASDDGFDGYTTVYVTGLPTYPNNSRQDIGWDLNGRVTDTIYHGTTVPNYRFRYEGSSYSGYYDVYFLERIELADNVTSIGDYAFAGLANLEELDNIDYITSVGEYAFQNCSSLETLPENITSIGRNAFYGCAAINFASGDALSDQITEIPRSAFNRCASLVLSKLPDDLVTIGSFAFYTCANIEISDFPSGLTSIGEYAFYGCSKITVSRIPDAVTVLKEYTFYDCTAITSIIANGITAGARHLFEGCTSLVSFTALSYSNNLIPEYMFADCQALTTLDLGNAVITTVNPYAFYRCTSLVDFPYASTLTKIETYAFFGCTSLLTFVANNLTTLASYVFRDCSALTAVSLGACTSLSYGDFMDCVSLTTLSMPALTGNATQEMARRCTALTTCDIGSAPRIESLCFDGDTSLSVLIIRRTSGVCQVNNLDSFRGTPIRNGSGTVYVPSALIASYQSASYWSTFYSAGTQFVALEGSIYE